MIHAVGLLLPLFAVIAASVCPCDQMRNLNYAAPAAPSQVCLTATPSLLSMGWARRRAVTMAMPTAFHILCPLISFKELERHFCLLLYGLSTKARAKRAQAGLFDIGVYGSAVELAQGPVPTACVSGSCSRRVRWNPGTRTEVGKAGCSVRSRSGRSVHPSLSRLRTRAVPEDRPATRGANGLRSRARRSGRGGSQWGAWAGPGPGGGAGGGGDTEPPRTSG